MSSNQLLMIEKSSPSNAQIFNMNPATEAASFESSMIALESIIQSLENGDTPLAELLSKFEEGAQLIAHCRGQLTDAELKIEKIESTISDVSKVDCSE